MNATTSKAAAFAGGIAMAFAFQVGLTVFAPLPVAAAPVPTRVSETSTAEASPADVQPAIAVDMNDDLTNCSRARRRLWVDGEGWIVRRITTCH